jgi:hypothetical protein
MAGAFGFEEDKYEVSKAIGELELLPAVRKAPTDWLIIADGFSCREQIAQETDRHALHLAEVLQMALHEQMLSVSGSWDEGLELIARPPLHFPEDAFVRPRHDAIKRSMKRTGLTMAGMAAGAALLYMLARKR